MDAPEDEDEDEGGDKDQVPVTRPHWQSVAHSQCATHLWLATLSRYLIVSQYLGEGVEDLLVCSGNM